MKYTVLLFLTYTLFLMSSSCNSQSETNTENQTTNTDTISVITESDPFISRKEANDLSGEFEMYYKKTGTPEELTHFNTVYWTSKCAFIALSDFLKDNNYDGARIFFSADESTSDTHIQWIPTTSKPGSPNEEIDHENHYNIKITLNQECEISPMDEGINMDENTAESQRKKFWDVYREQKQLDLGVTGGRDSISAAIWFDADFIKTVADKVNELSDADGINIHMGAYSQLDNTAHKGQLYMHQTTVYFLPSKNDNGKHVDYWDAIDPKRESALNHGQLCPIICQ